MPPQRIGLSKPKDIWDILEPVAGAVDWVRGKDKPGEADAMIRERAQPYTNAIRMAGEFAGVPAMYRGLKPNASIKDRLIAGATVAGYGGAFDPAIEWAVSKAAAKISPAVQFAMQKASQRLNPTADLSPYIFHGGPTPDKLVGGVIDPDYVRGGKLLPEVNPIYARQPSLINGGLNDQEAISIRNLVDEAKRALSERGPGGRFGINDPNDPNIYWMTKDEIIQRNADRLAEAQKIVDDHAEIIRRMDAGENHGTGVSYMTPGLSYSTAGGVHVLKVDPKLMTGQAMAPGGEIKFWGKQKPVGFVPDSEFASWTSEGENIPTLWDGKNPGPGYQIAINDADMASVRTQRLANALAKARGTQITPAYKQHIVRMLEESRLNSVSLDPDNIRGVIKDVPNLPEVVQAVKSAKTKDEVIAALKSLSPGYGYKSGLNPKPWDRDLKWILDRANELDPSYSRLKRLQDHEG